jgi:hypothetical protein
MDKKEWLSPNPYDSYVEIRDNCTDLGSPYLPCPYVEIRDIRTGLGLVILQGQCVNSSANQRLSLISAYEQGRTAKTKHV